MCGPGQHHYTYGHMAQWLVDTLQGTLGQFALDEIVAVEYYTKPDDGGRKIEYYSSAVLVEPH